MKEKLSHIDDSGHARMVDVGDKPIVTREAIAEGFITLASNTLRAIAEGKNPKGEVFGTARLAGIMAAKKCGELIPLCHPLPLESVSVNFEIPAIDSTSHGPQQVRIEATAKITAKTGVEMEALTAVSIAALTIYDMCKAIDKTMVIDGIRLLRKTKQPIESNTTK
ncbi:MAG: cyclic pyranopterin monophosphate synthase MoaC [Phycisphaerae bacterium]|nr:cyclic pyranopterin monophosphate synthase MoaC [Phycisphaerae bacterium]